MVSHLGDFFHNQAGLGENAHHEGEGMRDFFGKRSQKADPETVWQSKSALCDEIASPCQCVRSNGMARRGAPPFPELQNAVFLEFL
jgi:hypothetical protein